LLAHSGEINSEISTYDGDRFLIISQAVSPGSSGAPVLDESGMCVGMVVRALELQYENGRIISSNAAIPAEEMEKFIVAQGY